MSESKQLPMHPFEVRISIGGETWDYVRRALQQLADHALEREADRFQMCSGGAGGSYSATVATRDVSPEKFREELMEWSEIPMTSSKQLGSGEPPKHDEDCVINGVEGWNGERFCSCGADPKLAFDAEPTAEQSEVSAETAPRVTEDAWKEAVIEACVVNCIGWNENDPVKSLAGLIKWEVQTALDPKVSEAAQKLIDQGRAGMGEQIERLRFRLFYFNPNFKGHSHTTACTIWREDGQGHAEGFEGDRGPCNCGALENFYRDKLSEATSLRPETGVKE